MSLLVITSLVFSACGSASEPDTGACAGEHDKVCVTVTLTQPIHFNEPIAVPIVVQTKEYISGLIITLSTSDPTGATIEGQREWTVDAKANQPIQVTGAIRFMEEGYFTVIARAGIPGMVATASEAVQITLTGGTVDPTPPTGTPLAATDLPLSDATQATPTLTPPPISTDRTLPYLPPAQVINQCGWSAGTTALREWQGAKAYIQIPAQVTVNTPVPVIVGFEFEKSSQQPQTVQVKVGLCLTDLSIQVEGEREWSLTVQAGMPVTRTTTLRCTQTGEFAARAGAYDAPAGRVTSGGQRTWAVSEGADLQNPSPAGALSAAQSASGWITITTENFELAWPSAGWSVSDLSNDGYDRRWDDDNYRARPDPNDPSPWAAWPARGGTHGRDPVAGNDDYFNNMNTRMQYGPFDLSDAAVAEVSFWLWREFPNTSDYLVLEASHDGIAFQELTRWNTTNKSWQLQTVSLKSTLATIRYGSLGVSTATPVSRLTVLG
jgi:hypothetical protein